MKRIFYIQYWNRKQWRKTSLGNEMTDDGLICYHAYEEAREMVNEMHKRQQDAGFTRLVKYRIIERIYDETIHEI